MCQLRNGGRDFIRQSLFRPQEADCCPLHFHCDLNSLPLPTIGGSDDICFIECWLFVVTCEKLALSLRGVDCKIISNRRDRITLVDRNVQGTNW